MDEQVPPTAQDFETEACKKRPDKEVAAMAKITHLIESLDPMARDRVITWACTRFGGCA